MNVEYNSYTKEELHVEKVNSANEEIQGFGYDIRQSVLILLYSSTDGSGRTSIKIQDIKNGKQLWWQPVKNEFLIGIMRSGIFNLIDGHLYTSEYIIKIRYDLLF